MSDDRCSSCDPTAPRVLDQSGMRFNDQASFNLLAAQQNFIMSQQQAWSQLLKDNRQDTYNIASLQMEFLKQLGVGE